LTHILVAFERQVSFVKLLHNYLNLKYMMGTFFWPFSDADISGPLRTATTSSVKW